VINVGETMKMDFSMNLIQEQKLIMTQQMQLSVKLLQMSSMELVEYVENQLQENPLLDVKYAENINEAKTENRIDYKELIKYYEFDNYSHRGVERNEDSEISPLNFVSRKKSLKETLEEQLIENHMEDELQGLCRYLIENLNEKGYLEDSIECITSQLKKPRELIEKALSILQSFEPAGIAARDLKECLKLQLHRKNYEEEELYLIVDNFLEELSENKYNVIARELNIDAKKAQHFGDIIKSLEPKPSRGFYTGEEVKYIQPDAYIKKIDGEYLIIMNEEITPHLTINPLYKHIINNEEDNEAVEYVKDKLNNALFLIKSIEHRKSTIYRVLERIVELQKDYFEYGDDYIKPMTLKDVAETLEMHESTVSRAIKEKYIFTPRGTIKIKDLFSLGLSSTNSSEDVSVRLIKSRIKELIEKENNEKPLSDQLLCDILNSEGFNISRRTVAKYREELGIKSSAKRKRF